MASDTEGPHEARSNAAKRLEGLYGTVIAIGIGIAVTATVTTVNDRLVVAWAHVPLVGALLVTLVPFYHGALLHLDAKYSRSAETNGDRGDGRDETRPTNKDTGVLLVDFAFLFLEAVVIVALATSVADVRSFVAGLTVLLAMDVLWAIVAWHLADEHAGLLSWMVINLTTVTILGLGLIAGIWVDYPDHTLTVSVVLLAFLRSAVDYNRNWEFYGGSDENRAKAKNRGGDGNAVATDAGAA
jgi:hypothetical protein